MRPRDARAARTTPRPRMLAISARRSFAVMLSGLRVVSNVGSEALRVARAPLLRVTYAGRRRAALSKLSVMGQKKRNGHGKRKEKIAKQKRRKRRKARDARTALSQEPARMRENRRFNRLESHSDHFYIEDYGRNGIGSSQYEGWVKCKLLHGAGYSLIIVDQVYLDRGGLRWIQPLALGCPCVLSKLSDTEIVCTLWMDISCGHSLEVRLVNHDHVTDFADGSQLFKCTIRGPAALDTYATGEAEWGFGEEPYLRLFHHTTASTVPLILDSGHFRAGSFNIQGAQKRLKNVAYAYFTPLDAIRNDSDLKKIAMAEGGFIVLRRDGFVPPPVVEPGFLEAHKNDIVQLDVYRCEPAKREAAIDMWIASSVLAPQHIYRHHEDGRVYYELPHHFIHRVGVEPGRSVTFDGENRIHRQEGLKSFDYIVVGDCTTHKGLVAPYDEEDTTHVMKVERMEKGQTMLEFWFEHGNSDLFTGKSVEMQEFGPPGEAGPAACQS